MKQTSIVRAAVITALAVVTAGCGSGSSPTASRTSTASASSNSSSGGTTTTTTTGGGSGSGTFRTGHATTVTPSETIKLDFDTGSFIKALGSHGSVSVNWADNDLNDLGLLGDGNGGYSSASAAGPRRTASLKPHPTDHKETNRPALGRQNHLRGHTAPVDAH